MISSDPYAKTPITKLNLLPLTQNTLRKVGISTIGDFESADASGTVLYSAGIGPNTAAEIRDAIKAYKQVNPADGSLKIVGDFILVNSTTWIKISMISKVVTVIVRRDPGPDEYAVRIFLNGSDHIGETSDYAIFDGQHETKAIIGWDDDDY